MAEYEALYIIINGSQKLTKKGKFLAKFYFFPCKRTLFEIKTQSNFSTEYLSTEEWLMPFFPKKKKKSCGCNGLFGLTTGLGRLNIYLSVNLVIKQIILIQRILNFRRNSSRADLILWVEQLWGQIWYWTGPRSKPKLEKHKELILF